MTAIGNAHYDVAAHDKKPVNVKPFEADYGAAVAQKEAPEKTKVNSVFVPQGPMC